MPLGYVLNRLGLLLLIIFIAISINFLIPRLIPGDPIESALRTQLAISGSVSVDIEALAASHRAKFGLDKPQWRQYISYWTDILKGDMGVSLVSYPDSVSGKIKDALPWTLGLLVISTIIAFVVGSTLGALLAWPRSPRAIKAVVPILMLFSAIPYYLLAIVLVFFFAIVWAILPPAGGFSPILILDMNWESTMDIIRHAILPAISIVLGGIGFWALGMRSMMIGVLGEDYINMAEAKGLPPRRIFVWYGMRNAILPQITAMALAMGFILSGSVLVEVIFSYPGLGQLLFQAIAGKDFFVIQGIVLMLILALGFTLLVVDLIYPFVDPRIRISKS